MTTTTVVVPWRDGCDHRRRALAWTLPRLERAADQVLIGELPAEAPWCKAAAVAAALPEVTGDVLAIVDADLGIDDELWLQRCVTALVVGHDWAMPHGPVWRLGPAGTDRVVAGDAPDDWVTPKVVTDSKLGRSDLLDQPPYNGFDGGGCVVLPTELYERVPLDPRFVGWGQEDEAWAHALSTLAGEPWRGEANLWHLWHPPQPRMDRRWGSPASEALGRRYEAASGDPDTMADLVAEITAPTRVAR